MANEYRPLLIRRYGLLAVLVFVFGIQLLYNVGTTGNVLGDKADISRVALLDETNQARREHGLGELKLDQKLNRAAQLKAADMFDRQYWAHEAPDGTKPWRWFAEAQYDYAEAGENLAMNFYTAEATMTAWMHSEEHRANILSPKYTDAGFAVLSGTLHDKSATIVVALYGRPAATGASLTSTAVAGAHSQQLGLVTRLGVGLQSMTPAALGSIVILGIVAVIAFLAHLYRGHLPSSRRRSWHRHHHGAVKMGGMFSLILLVLLIYGGGQV